MPLSQNSIYIEFAKFFRNPGKAAAEHQQHEQTSITGKME